MTWLVSDAEDWRLRYRQCLGDVVVHATSALGITLAMLGLDRALGALHGGSTAFHDAVYLLLHYAQALPAILAFVGVSLMLLLITMLLDRWKAARALRLLLVMPAVQSAEHTVTLGLGVFGAWAVVEPQASGFAALSGARGLAAIVLALSLLLATAFLCTCVVQFMQVDYPRLVARHGRKRYPVALGALALLLSALYWGLVLHYPGIGAAH